MRAGRVQGGICDGAAALVLEKLERGEGGYLVLAGGVRGCFGLESTACGASVWVVGGSFGASGEGVGVCRRG